MTALLHFDMKRAFLCNPTVVYGAVMCLWCLIGFVAEKIFHKKISVFKPRLWMLTAGVVLFLGFAIFRNMVLCQFGYDYLGDLT